MSAATATDGISASGTQWSASGRPPGAGTVASTTPFRSVTTSGVPAARSSAGSSGNASTSTSTASTAIVENNPAIAIGQRSTRHTCHRVRMLLANSADIYGVTDTSAAALRPITVGSYIASIVVGPA